MKALIFGGSGFVGRNLTEELVSNGYEVCIVTRNSQKIAKSLVNKGQVIKWDNHSPISSIKDLPEIDAVINLAGESIGNRRWSDSVQQEILVSRIRTTNAIVTAINNRTIVPKVFINASAVGYYGHHLDEMIYESEESGNDFLAHTDLKTAVSEQNAIKMFTALQGNVLTQ